MSTFTWQSSVRGRLDAVLAEDVTELSRSRATALVREGHVTVDGQVVTKASLKVSVGQSITVVLPEPKTLEAVAQEIPMDVVFEDADLIVVNKAAGMVVHPAPGHPNGTLVLSLIHI